MNGLRIKAIRKSLNWTQPKMADYLGVSEITIRRWEHGKFKPCHFVQPKIDKLEQELTLLSFKPKEKLASRIRRWLKL